MSKIDVDYMSEEILTLANNFPPEATQEERKRLVSSFLTGYLNRVKCDKCNKSPVKPEEKIETEAEKAAKEKSWKSFHSIMGR